uniref:Uncharacterized protein n=1 Tax=Anguilla anguilla TaxID=7936 RepID=A0A0E9SZT3_ANGAN
MGLIFVVWNGWSLTFELTVSIYFSFLHIGYSIQVSV